MKGSSFRFQDLMPYVAAILVFYLATVLYFKAEIIDGKTITQTDVLQFKGMSRSTIAYKETQGRPALWNDAMFSGMPDYLISTPLPDWPTKFIWRITQGFLKLESAGQLFFAALISFWTMLLCFRVNPWLAAGGALLFALNSFYIVSIEAGHLTKCWAIAYSALVIGGMHLVFRQKWLAGFALLAVGMTLQLRPPHYQITFYLLFVCVAYALSEAIFLIREKQMALLLRQFGLMAVAVGLAASTATARLWMTQEYTPHSIRGKVELTQEDQRSEGLDKDYAFNWSQGKMETLTLLVPYFYGGSSSEALQKGSNFYEVIERLAGPQQAAGMVGQPMVPLYRGDQPFTSGPLYAGAIVCFLFALAMFILPDRQRYWMLGAIVISVLFAWGRNFETFNFFLFDTLPGFNKFRSVSMALSMVLMLMPLAGILALNQLWQQPGSLTLKKMLYAVGTTGGLALLIALGAGMSDFSTPKDAVQIGRMFQLQDTNVVRMLTDALEDDRAAFARSDAFRSLFFILLAAGAIWLWHIRKLKATWALALVILAGITDLWVVDRRYLNDENFKTAPRSQEVYVKTAADEKILADPDPHYRVLNFRDPFTEAGTSYWHKSVGGYFAAKMRRYQDLIEEQLIADMQNFASAIRSGAPSQAHTPALNMLNAKYFKLDESANGVFRNPNALGHAWFVEEVLTVSSADEEIEALASFDPASEAIVNGTQFAVQQASFQSDSTASVRLVSYENRHIVYEAANANPGLIVFSEVYYPHGWQVTINGTEATPIRANYVLRALEVPAGNNRIEFRFEPASYEVGSVITGASSYLVALLVLVAGGLAIFRATKPSDEPTNS